MAVDERDRHRLHQRLEGLEARMRLGHEALEQRILATVRGEASAQTRLFFFSMLGMNITLVTLVFAAVRSA